MYRTQAENRQWLLNELDRFRDDPIFGRWSYAVWTARHGQPLPTDAVTPLPHAYKLIGIGDGYQRPEDRTPHDSSGGVEDLFPDGDRYRPTVVREHTFELRWLACLPGQLADHRYSILVQEHLDEHDKALRIVHHRTALHESIFGLDGGTTTVNCYPDEEGRTATVFFAEPQERADTAGFRRHYLNEPTLGDRP